MGVYTAEIRDAAKYPTFHRVNCPQPPKQSYLIQYISIVLRMCDIVCYNKNIYLVFTPFLAQSFLEFPK